jgi:hypothetical protein
MSRWFRSYWDDEDTWYSFEVDGEGWVTRQVELVGSDQVPRSAASLAEWQRALAEGRIQQYQARYGALADQPLGEWDAKMPREDLAQAEFEQAWQRARRQLEAKQ